jgi:pyocin large subunit-like protein
VSAESEYRIAEAAQRPRDNWRDEVWTWQIASSEKLLLLALADHADASGCCEISVADLSHTTGLHERTVRRMLKEFALRGLIARGNRRDGHNAYRYRLVGKG